VGCGRIAPKPELVRIALADHGAPRERGRARRAVVDTAGKLPGRGAYLCRGVDPAQPNPDCLAHALHRGGLARTLRRPVALDLPDRSTQPTNS
jgi:predicted RNA-binding protein YlxR (DUF448 family)